MRDGELGDCRDAVTLRCPQALEATTLEAPIDIAIADPFPRNPVIEDGIATEHAEFSQPTRSECSACEQLRQFVTPPANDFLCGEALLKASPHGPIDASDAGDPAIGDLRGLVIGAGDKAVQSAATLDGQRVSISVLFTRMPDADAGSRMSRFRCHLRCFWLFNVQGSRPQVGS